MIFEVYAAVVHIQLFMGSFFFKKKNKTCFLY